MYAHRPGIHPVIHSGYSWSHTACLHHGGKAPLASSDFSRDSAMGQRFAKVSGSPASPLCQADREI
jgi:hypothetical protein